MSRTKIVNNAFTHFLIDPASGFLVVAQDMLARVNRGEVFDFFIDTTFDNAEELDYHLEVKDEDIFLNGITLACKDNDVEVQLRKGHTITKSGDPTELETFFNSKEGINASAPVPAVIYTDSSITDTGTLRYFVWEPGEDGVGARTVGVSALTSWAIRLEANTDYVIRLKRNSGTGEVRVVLKGVLHIAAPREIREFT